MLVVTALAAIHAATPSTLRVHDSMTLSALVAAVKSADIRICLTVTEHFGTMGFGDIMSFRMLPLKFAIAHAPHLRYQFAPIGAMGGAGAHHVEQFGRHIFASAPEGSGCKRDGSDGRRMPVPLCAKVSSEPSSGALRPVSSVKPIVGRSMWTIVGDSVLISGNHTGLVQDGDTVTICDFWGSVRGRLHDHDARSARPALMEAFYRGASEPPAIAEAHAAGMLAVSVHLRNGDTAGENNAFHRMRHTHAADLIPMMRAVAELPTGCASVLIVTERAEDSQALEFRKWFAVSSQNRTAVAVLDGKLCDGPCAFHALAQSDVLVAVTSAFSYTAAVVTKDNATLAFASAQDHENVESLGNHVENASAKLHRVRAQVEGFKEWREHVGRPYLTTRAQLSAALRSRLPARCHPRL